MDESGELFEMGRAQVHTYFNIAQWNLISFIRHYNMIFENLFSKLPWNNF